MPTWFVRGFFQASEQQPGDKRNAGYHLLTVYLPSVVSRMESLNTFESEMEADGQGSYSLFPALDSIASLSGTPETLERFFFFFLHCDVVIIIVIGFKQHAHLYV